MQKFLDKIGVALVLSVVLVSFAGCRGGHCEKEEPKHDHPHDHDHK